MTYIISKEHNYYKDNIFICKWFYDNSHVHTLCIANSVPFLFNETPAEPCFYIFVSHNIVSVKTLGGRRL